MCNFKCAETISTHFVQYLWKGVTRRLFLCICPSESYYVSNSLIIRKNMKSFQRKVFVFGNKCSLMASVPLYAVISLSAFLIYSFFLHSVRSVYSWLQFIFKTIFLQHIHATAKTKRSKMKSIWKIMIFIFMQLFFCVHFIKHLFVSHSCKIQLVLLIGLQN